ncbi:hypothetical protein BC830DRAFT_1107769 [Chytriomyces sp. MP71]|nr:hypothetical protein BC830DRAFT_1107769 [Chytriomyces sp. MP71]
MAGPGLKAECRLLNGCETGHAKITLPHKISSCKRIIHTVGPMDGDPSDLANCYKSSLALLVSNALTSIAFPCIATGIYGFPHEPAARIALSTVRAFLDGPQGEKVDKVYFVTYLRVDHEIYTRLVPEYFPSKELDLEEKKGQEEKEEGEGGWQGIPSGVKGGLQEQSTVTGGSSESGVLAETENVENVGHGKAVDGV